MPSLKTLPKLHRELWLEFSRYIRYRDCLRTTGATSQGRCVTCDRQYPFNTLQAGHFISRVSYATRYDERNVHAQCPSCNLFKKGNIDEYFVRMEQMYGREVVDELLSLKHSSRRFKRYEIEELVIYYREKNKETDQ